MKSLYCLGVATAGSSNRKTESGAMGLVVVVRSRGNHQSHLLQDKPCICPAISDADASLLAESDGLISLSSLGCREGSWGLGGPLPEDIIFLRIGVLFGVVPIIIFVIFL